MIVTELIRSLIELPNMCIWGLINKSNKTIYIFQTKNIVTSISRYFQDYKYSNEEFIIFESISDKHNLWPRLNYWISYYSNLNYTIINKPKHKIQYKVRIEILKDFRMRKETRYLCYVKVVSRRCKELTVGIFNTVPEADEFVSRFYPENTISDIIYSNNQLMKDYRCLEQ